MITTLIGIQTTCVIVATSYLVKQFKSKKAQLKVSSISKDGFKHYKTF